MKYAVGQSGHNSIYRVNYRKKTLKCRIILYLWNTRARHKIIYLKIIRGGDIFSVPSKNSIVTRTKWNQETKIYQGGWIDRLFRNVAAGRRTDVEKDKSRSDDCALT